MARWCAYLLCGCLLSACASLLGPRTVELSQARLQQWVDARFPLDNRVLDLLDLHVSAPRLTMLPDTDQIRTVVNIDVGDRLFKLAHHGTLVLDFGVRFEPGDNTLRVTRMHVGRIEIDGVPAHLQQQIVRIGAELFEQVLDDHIVYALRAKDVDALQARGYKPGEIHVTPSGVVFTLVALAPG